MKVLIFLCTLLVFANLPVSGQDSLLRRDLTKTFKRYDLLSLNTKAVQSQARSGEKIRISAYGRDFEFDLVLNDLRAANYRAVETNSNGTYTLDTARFKELLTEQPETISRLFAALGVPSDSGVAYAFSTDNTQVGTYAVNVSTAATSARGIVPRPTLSPT